jgi:hypothetical protein
VGAYTPTRPAQGVWLFFVALGQGKPSPSALVIPGGF